MAHSQRRCSGVFFPSPESRKLVLSTFFPSLSPQVSRDCPLGQHYSCRDSPPFPALLTLAAFTNTEKPIRPPSRGWITTLPKSGGTRRNCSSSSCRCRKWKNARSWENISSPACFPASPRKKNATEFLHDPDRKRVAFAGKRDNVITE